jgi:hypothetical protein
MLRRMIATGVIAAILWIAAIVSIALSVLDGDVGAPSVSTEQDVEAYVLGNPPGGHPPGEEDQEDTAQTLFEGQGW